MLRDLLTMAGVQVARKVETPDGMGGTTTTTTLTTLSAAVIYQNNSNNSFVSDRLNKKSSHVLVTEPSMYSWNSNDECIVNGSDVYVVSSLPDDVMGYGEITVVGLERVT